MWGANIGLFTLYLSDHWPELRIYAFEPVPEVFERLRVNVGLYGLEVKLYECGLWQRSGEVELVYYPNWSSMSGAYGDEREEEEVTRRILARRGGEVAAHAEELLAGRFRAERRRCRMRTVSEVVAEEGLERIDLLKVDVEKSEQEVLAGIREEDWEKIKQVVVEVHDREGSLGRLERELARRGYQVEWEQEAWLEGTGLYNLYGVRREELARRAAAGAGVAEGADSNGGGNGGGGLLPAGRVECERSAAASGRAAAGVHGAVGDRGAGAAAVDWERESGPRGAAGARGGGAGSRWRVRGGAEPAGSGVKPHLE